MEWNDETLDYLRRMMDDYHALRRRITPEMPKNHFYRQLARAYERLFKNTPASGDCDWCDNRQKVLNNLGCFVCDLCLDHARHSS